MEEKIELWNELCKNFSHLKNVDNSKYTIFLNHEDVIKKNLEFLSKYNIIITEPRKIEALLYAPEKIENQVKSFADYPCVIEAIKDDPMILAIPKEVVLRNIGRCETLGKTYVDENGKACHFIFDVKEFKKVIEDNLTDEQKEIISTPTEPANNDSKEVQGQEVETSEVKDETTEKEESGSIETKDEFDNSKIKEYALLVLQQFAAEANAPMVYNKLDELEKTAPDLSVKEKLIQALSLLGGDIDLLSGTVDTVLSQDEENKRSL